MKTGQGQTLSLMNGLLIMILILIALSFISCTIMQENADVRSKVLFDKFVRYYSSCQEISSQDCSCDFFEFDQLQKNQQIQLIPLASGNIEIRLLNLGVREPVLSQIVKGENLCTYNYDKRLKKFQRINKQSYTFSSVLNEGYKGTTSLVLYKDKETPCIIEPKDYLYLLKEKTSCTAKKTTPKQNYTFLLNLRSGTAREYGESDMVNYNAYTSRILVPLAYSLNKLGKVHISAYEGTALHQYAGKSISQQRGIIFDWFGIGNYEENVKNEFTKLYTQFNQSLTNKSIIIISIRTDWEYDYLEDSGSRKNPLYKEGTFILMHHPQAENTPLLLKHLSKELVNVSIVKDYKPHMLLRTTEKAAEHSDELTEIITFIKTPSDLKTVPIIFIDVLSPPTMVFRKLSFNNLYEKPEPMIEAIVTAVKNYITETEKQQAVKKNNKSTPIQKKKGELFKN
tara:strand:+ start:64 stop:1425 length:1362 start_codon:yes stop_codon:yes gene_type:complete